MAPSGWVSCEGDCPAREINNPNPNRNVKVIAPPEREITAWIGGAIIGCLEKSIWASKADYDELGAYAVQRIPYDCFVDYKGSDSMEGWLHNAMNFAMNYDSIDDRIKIDTEYDQPEYWRNCEMQADET